MIQKCETINEFIVLNAENYEKWEMVWYINKEFNISHKDAEKIYNAWRTEYLSIRNEYDDEPKEKVVYKTLEEALGQYVSSDKNSITIDNLCSLIYCKKLGVKSREVIAKHTGLTNRQIQNVYIRVNRYGYKVDDLEKFDFNKIKVYFNGGIRYGISRS